MDTKKAPPIDFSKVNAPVNVLQVENMINDKLKHVKRQEESILVLAQRLNALEDKYNKLASKESQPKQGKKGDDK